MATKYGILDSLDSKLIEAILLEQSYTDDFFFPKFFPWKQVLHLEYETLVGSKGYPVAADFIAYEASAPIKTRKTIDKLSGTIPKTAMKKIATKPTP